MNDMDTSFYPKAGEGVTDFNQLMRMQPGDYNQLMPMEQPQNAVMELADASGEPTSRGVQAFQFFLQKGWPPVAAASIVGRLQQESGPNFTAVRGDRDKQGNPTAFGIGHWRGPRKQTLQALARERGTSIDDFMTGLEHTHWELTEGPEAKWGEKLRSAQDIREGLGYMHSAWRPAASKAVEVARSARYAAPLLADSNVRIEPISGPPPNQWTPPGGREYGYVPEELMSAPREPLRPDTPMQMRGPDELGDPRGAAARMGQGRPMGGTTPPPRPVAGNALTSPSPPPGAPWFGSTNPYNKVVHAGQNMLHPMIGFGN
jgi:hypothetical protein